jgi:SAM-dependent methyltransferase
MSRLVSILDQWLYPEHGGNWDDTLFRERVLRRLTPSAVVLDLGAGAGIVEQMNFKGCAARVCGVDLDPRVVTNPMLDEGRVGNASDIPYKDMQFDLVFADNVVEHLADPLASFNEVFRVLKPGGVFLFKTPNRAHYMPFIARSTPHGFHQFINRLRGRDEADTFPTLYRANTAVAIGRVAEFAGFEVQRLEHVEGRPEYLRLTWPTYLLGAAYERLVNATERFAGYRILLIAELHKS